MIPTTPAEINVAIAELCGIKGAPCSRLNSAAACGVIREGHQMTMVRLDDVKSLCGAVMIAEKELESMRANCASHEAYAHMMQEQRSQIAIYCKTLEKQIEALKPPSSP